MTGSRLRQVLFADEHDGWLPVLLVALTVLSGVVDAVSILALGHVFVANMTGNLAFVGFALGGAPGFSVAASAVALAAFMVGVAATRLRRAPHRAALLRDAMLVQAALLAVAAAVSAVAGRDPAAGPRYAMIAVAAVALGIQNGAVQRLTGPANMTTTVITRTLVGFVADLAVSGRESAEVRALTSILALVVGAVGGAFLVRDVHPAAGLAVAAGLALCVGLASVRTPQWAIRR